ncbi:MAG TPA: hypothetical protein VK929_03760 [Longimicrobiales bacterium]|nr:hypothetical protein [Longimicrobiales bacterium]
MSEHGIPESFEVKTADFFTRRGFLSGDLLRPALPHLNAGDVRDLLVEVLQRHVVPSLDQKVQTYAVPTVHNPLRVTSVDGVEVVWATPAEGRGPAITPPRVTVMLQDVLACARRLRLSVPTPEAT